MNRLFAFPKRLSLMSTPLSRNTLSYAKEPAIATCPAFGVLVVSPGARAAMAARFRFIASLSTTCSYLKLVATCVSVRIDADVPTTSTDSCTFATAIVGLDSALAPSPTSSFCSTVPNPVRLNVTT